MSSVDVVVPCYNYGRYLQQCINSVLDQEEVDVRVLIIDDCSSDNTREVGRRLARRDPRVEFRRHKMNKGHIATYNEGLLEWATADYSLLLSADDLLVPGALARAAGVMDRHPDSVLTYGFVYKFYEGEQLNAENTIQSDDFRIVPGARVLRYCCETGTPITQTAAAVVRTIVQHEIGGYRADLPHSGDMEMWMRFAVHGPVGVVRATQGFYRKHSNNMSDRYYNRSTLRDRRERLQALDVIFTHWRGRISDLDDLRRIAKKSFSNEAYWMAARSLDVGDAEGARECLAFAEEVFPELRGTWVCTKLRTKMMMGPILWRYVRSLIDQLRGSMDTPPPQEDRYEGWWPD
jgi:glycosyltransferase involved in cell wall biosynthesis